MYCMMALHHVIIHEYTRDWFQENWLDDPRSSIAICWAWRQKRKIYIIFFSLIHKRKEEKNGSSQNPNEHYYDYYIYKHYYFLQTRYDTKGYVVLFVYNRALTVDHQ